MQQLFSLYEQYDRTQSCIDLLVEQQFSIRTMIATIQNNTNTHANTYANTHANTHANFNQRRHHNHPQNSSRSVRRNQRRNFSNNENVFYDYNDPIQPRQERRTSTSSSVLESFINSFLNTSVPIRPSISQINTATRIIRYGDIREPTSERCPISLEPFTTQQNVRQIIHCQHLFCESSFQEWFSNHVQCPVCRYDIRDYSEPDTQETIRNTAIDTQETRRNTAIDTQETRRNTAIDTDDTEEQETTSSFNHSIENINYIRDPRTNEIDSIVFDIVDDGQANELLSNVSNNLLQSLFQNPLTRNTTMSDASASMFVYETIWRPHR